MPSPRIRLIALAFALLSGLLLLAWLISGNTPDKSNNPDSRVGVPGARQLRLGLNIAAGSALHAGALKFAEQVELRSKGTLTVAVFPDQKLGNDDQMLEMARKGELDLVLTPSAKLSSAIPAMQYADLPFYFSSRDELYAMLDGAPGQLLLSKLGSIDLIGLTFWENGFKQFTANTPIRTPEDFARLRIRTMKSPMIADQFSTLGAQPIPIDFHATYQALADGAVDGQENPLVAIVGMRFHQVQKHLTISNHGYLGYVFSASKRSFETLSPELREIIQQTARELTAWERAETARRETDLIEQIRAAGVQIHTLTPEQLKQFRTAMAPLADKFGFVVGYDLLAKTEEARFALATAKLPAEEQPWIIGLSTDLSSHGAHAGGALYRGIQLAIEDINKKGGLLGRPLRLVAHDNAANAQLAARDLGDLARHSTLVGIIGGIHSGIIADLLPAIHEQQIPYLIPWAPSPGLLQHDYQPSYTFRSSLPDTQSVPFLLEQARKTGGKIALLIEHSYGGKSSEAILKPLLAKFPSGSIETIPLEIGDPRLTTRLKQLDEGEFSAVVLLAHFGEGMPVIQHVARMKRKIPVFAHWNLICGDLPGRLGKELAQIDLRFVQPLLMEDARRRPALAAADRLYRQRFSLPAEQAVPAAIGTWQAYDLTQLLARAATRAKSGDRPRIRDALESLPAYTGIMQDYAPAFKPGRHEALDGIHQRMARFNDRGHIVAAE